mmetsp:Transcript_5988/g.15416  ORF Transcript_5988/g.15416 Transcript_5988/m.15416 type:complete len:233 (-) Transcript_5988:181-879(-)
MPTATAQGAVVVRFAALHQARWRASPRARPASVAVRQPSRAVRVGRAGAGGGPLRAAPEAGFPDAEAEAQYYANYQIWLENTQRDGAEAYEKLKTTLLKRTQRGGTFLTLYIFLIVNSPAALCTMLGAAGSYLYLWLLIKDVDGRDVEDGASTRVLDAEEVWAMGRARAEDFWEQAKRVPIEDAAVLAKAHEMRLYAELVAWEGTLCDGGCHRWSRQWVALYPRRWRAIGSR